MRIRMQMIMKIMMMRNYGPYQIRNHERAINGVRRSPRSGGSSI